MLVLAAEDDETDALLLKMAFGKAGLKNTLIIARDGQEAVEYLADRTGVQLRRTQEDDRTPRPKGPGRQRLVEAHKVAQEFYADALGSPEALTARQFLGERGFDQTAAEQFGIGFAPRDGDALLRHLTPVGGADSSISDTLGATTDTAPARKE